MSIGSSSRLDGSGGEGAVDGLALLERWSLVIAPGNRALHGEPRLTLGGGTVAIGRAGSLEAVLQAGEDHEEKIDVRAVRPLDIGDRGGVGVDVADGRHQRREDFGAFRVPSTKVRDDGGLERP